MDALQQIRDSNGARVTIGLEDRVIIEFLSRDPSLGIAIAEAHRIWKKLTITSKKTENDAMEEICKNWCHFYPSTTRNPYIPLSAKGPWIVTLYGAVLHDSGGYGMLGLGHNPDCVLEAMSRPQVMANIMTPSLSQKELIEALKREIGHSRESLLSSARDVYSQFLMMNSGSEGNSVAARIIDTWSSRKANGRKAVGISLKGSFHGRTFMPAVWTDSCTAKYQDEGCLQIVKAKDQYIRTAEPNDIEGLKALFTECSSRGEYVEAMFIESVMGEGNPGQAIAVDFYSAARELTLKHDSLLLVDSIQAGVRCTGCLSIVDYPGFQKVTPPDFEVFSKAVNAGQYPVSILAMSERTALSYKHGLYGNTMTGNPRACDVCVSVLKEIPSVRQNIRDMGKYALDRYEQLRQKYPSAITRVSGTGLLFAVHLDKKKFPVVAVNGAEMWLRTQGVGVIHGGENALRFTPHFRITKAELDLEVSMVEKFLVEFGGLLPTIQRLGESEVMGELSPASLKTAAKKTVKLVGHLFDSQVVNRVLDVVEKHQGAASFAYLGLGKNSSQESELHLEIVKKAGDVNAVVKEIMHMAEARGVKAELIDNDELLIL